MKRKKAGILVKIIVLVLLIYCAATIISLKVKIRDLREEQTELASQKEDLEVEISELEYYIDNSENDEVIADWARKFLNLFKSDDEMFYDSGN